MQDPVPYEAEDLPDYQVEVRIRNARFLRMMHRAGIYTVTELCRRIGKPNQMSRVGEFINLKARPLNAKGQYLPIVQSIADALFCEPDDLFSEKQRHNYMASNRFLVEVAEAEVEQRLARLEHRSAEQIIDEQDFRKGLQNMLDAAGLTPRERRIIELRFPQDGSKEQTLQQVANEFKVSKDRIRQIEFRALQKLKRVKAAKHVAPWLSSKQQALIEKRGTLSWHMLADRKEEEGG